MAVTVVLVPVVRWLSFRVGAVAVPGGRNIHERPTGRLGGVALAAGFLVSATAFVMLGSATRHDGFAQGPVAALVGIGVLATAVLVVDDIRQLPARYKFISQLVLAALVPALGVSIHF